MYVQVARVTARLVTGGPRWNLVRAKPVGLLRAGEAFVPIH